MIRRQHDSSVPCDDSAGCGNGRDADAQELASDLNQLRVSEGGRFPDGNRYGWSADARQVGATHASAIVLELPNKQRQQFDGAMVDTVEGRRGDSLKNGALMGLISGGALGIWAAGFQTPTTMKKILAPVIVAPVAPTKALGIRAVHGRDGCCNGTGIDALIHQPWPVLPSRKPRSASLRASTINRRGSSDCPSRVLTGRSATQIGARSPTLP